MEEQAIWFGPVSIDHLNERGRGTAIESLGIEVTGVGERSLTGRMPVDERTIQPAGVLHGGASVSLAEVLASWGGHLTVDPRHAQVVGQEINANHLRPVRSGGWVSAVATAVHLGRRAQVWEIRITDDDDRLVCISRCTLAVIETAGA